jgi:methyltransferase (TIGR00027 family)
MDPEFQVYAIKMTRKIIPEIEGIVETYKKNSKKGVSSYYNFLRRVQPSLEKMILEGLKNPAEVGHISSRLLRDPLSEELRTEIKSPEEEEAQIVGYLKAIVQFVYCLANGLEPWQFSSTPLHKESLKTISVGKIDIIPSLLRIVKKEIGDTLEGDFEIGIKEKINEKQEEKLDKVETTQNTLLWKEQKVNYLYQETNNDKTNVSFTARLMAYYRAQEYKNDSPLIIDPFAEQLAGDMTSYADKHKFIVGKGDYPLVRSYYIEKKLLTSWCNTITNSQIVLLGAGLDTRAYRFKPLQINKHTIFEIDFPTLINYKEMTLKKEKPICDLVRISADLSDAEWSSRLLKNGFSVEIPTFWVLEGLVYYMEQKKVVFLLEKIAEMSTKNSQIFVDLCVPILSELVFGPFTKHFRWGLEKKTVPAFFANAGWNVSCSYADDHDQGRDVGQRGLIFVHGTSI